MTDITGANDGGATSAGEIAALRDQLAAMRAERDQRVGDNNALAIKADAIARERDDLRTRLNDAEAERAKLSAEKAETARKLDEASRGAAAAQDEAARLKAQMEATPESDPLTVLWGVVQQLTSRAVAWVRSKIPAGSPLLPWFDKTVAAILKVGCLVVGNAIALVKWATPKAIDLFNQLKKQVEAKLEKK